MKILTDCPGNILVYLHVTFKVLSWAKSKSQVMFL